MTDEYPMGNVKKPGPGQAGLAHDGLLIHLVDYIKEEGPGGGGQPFYVILWKRNKEKKEIP